MESLDANVTFLSFLFLSCVCIQVGLGVDPNDDDKRVPLLVWEACAYTIQSGGQFILKLIVHTSSQNGQRNSRSKSRPLSTSFVEVCL